MLGACLTVLCNRQSTARFIAAAVLLQRCDIAHLSLKMPSQRRRGDRPRFGCTAALTAPVLDPVVQRQCGVRPPQLHWRLQRSFYVHVSGLRRGRHGGASAHRNRQRRHRALPHAFESTWSLAIGVPARFGCPPSCASIQSFISATVSSSPNVVIAYQMAYALVRAVNMPPPTRRIRAPDSTILSAHLIRTQSPFAFRGRGCVWQTLLLPHPFHRRGLHAY